MLQSKPHGGLALAVGMWLSASAALAAPLPDIDMPLGTPALAPTGFVDFCAREPLACGERSDQVLRRIAEVKAERAALLAMAAPAPWSNAAWTSAPGSVGPQHPPHAAASREVPPASVTPAAAAGPAQVGPERLAVRSSVRFTPLPAVADWDAAETAGAPEIAEAASTPAPAPLPAMTPKIWATLNGVNDRINHSIRAKTDAETYGQDDYWNTPLEHQLRIGDCEDFVLEKQRALLAAGLPREALNIALVTTRWGERHAVLLVATSAGEFVLDNLSPWVIPWRQAPYSWQERQLNGDPFSWVMVRRAPSAAAS